MNNKEYYIVISKNNKSLNFGQIVEYVSFNEVTEEAVVKAQGNNLNEFIHYTELWPCDEAYEYEALNKAMARIEKSEKAQQDFYEIPVVKELLKEV